MTRDRVPWGASICGSCSGELDLRGWLDQLRAPDPPSAPDVTDTWQIPNARTGYLRPWRPPITDPFRAPRPDPLGWQGRLYRRYGRSGGHS